MRLRSRTLRGTAPKVDTQYHIGVPPLDDLDRPHSRVVAPHSNPGDQFYNRDPVARSNPGSRGSSTEPMDTDEGQQTTNRLAQAIRDSSHLQRSGSLGEYPQLLFSSRIQELQCWLLPWQPTDQLGATLSMAPPDIAVSEAQERSVTAGSKMIKVSGGSARREAERTSLLNIPPYASQEGVEGEDPTLHRPEVVEPPEIFQRPGRQGARPKERVRYNTRTIGEEWDHRSHGERHPFEIRTDFYLPLPGQPRITELHAWRAPICTEQGNEGIYVRIDEWKDTYGTNSSVLTQRVPQWR